MQHPSTNYDMGIKSKHISCNKWNELHAQHFTQTNWAKTWNG
jgi:hypothetical protein